MLRAAAAEQVFGLGEGFRAALGEVLAPGQYSYVPNMTVETAVAIAGGYTPRAYRWNAEVSRSAGGLTARQKVPTIAPVFSVW